MKTPISTGTLQLRRILETSLYAGDLDLAKSFYKSVLGLELFAKEAGRHLFFKLVWGMADGNIDSKNP